MVSSSSVKMLIRSPWTKCTAGSRGVGSGDGLVVDFGLRCWLCCALKAMGLRLWGLGFWL